MPELLLKCRVRKLTGHWGALSFRYTLCSLRMVLVCGVGGGGQVGREGGEGIGEGEREKGERSKERERGRERGGGGG